MQPGDSVPPTSEIADLERKVEEIRDRMAPGKATDLELLDAQIALNEARLRHAVVTGQRQQALQALDALVQVHGRKVQVVQERLQVGKAAGRDLPEAALALYEARLRLAIMRNQAKEALAAADDAVRTQQQHADALRELLQVGKVPQEEPDAAARRLEEWRALRRQQALVVSAQGRLDQLVDRSGGQSDPKAIEGAKADLVAARKQVYILASLLMPAASDLLAGAAAGGAPLADQPADDATASAATLPQARPAASRAAASEPAAHSAAAARAPDRSQYEVPHPVAGAKANLVIRDFPARFADYNSMQGMPGPVILEPKPAFCKSDKPLFCDLTKGSVLPVKIILDQSTGPGGAYDTLYMDFNGNGDFLDDPVYKASPFDDAGSSMASYVRGYFRNVHIVRNRANKVTAHVQVMIMAGPSWPADPKACYLLFMAQKWAVGTVKLNGKDVPAALIDRTWNDSFIDARGLNPAEHPNVFPRSDYLVLAIDGEDKLISTGQLLNEGGTAYALLAKYLQLNTGLYEVRAEQSAEGVRLELLPAAPLPMGELEFSDVCRRPDPLMMIGTSTCVLLKKPGQTIRVPADTYYVPASMKMPGGDALVTVDAEDESAGSGQGGSAGAGAATQPSALASPQAKPVAAASQASAGPAQKALPTDIDTLLGGRKPYKVPASQSGQRCNLVWQDFPPGFGDYFCVQGTGAPAVPDPRPGFCKSDRPLLFHTPKGVITSALLFDQSKPDAPYDTLYVDLNDNGDFLDDPVYRARPYEGVGPDLEKVHSRFVNVQVVRNRDQKLRAHVQVYLEEVLFNATNQPRFSVSLVPQRWAVGTVRLKGRDVPAAVFDRTWNDRAVDQAGLNLHEYKDRYPRGDYLILEPAGGEDLRPGPPMPSRGGRGVGSPRTILNEYLQIGDDTYKVSAAQSEDGVQLALSPVQLPMGKVRVQITARASRVIGLKTSVLLPKPPEEGDVIAVPADTYVLLDYDAGLDAPAVVEPGQTADLPKLPFRLRPEPAGKPAVGDLAPDFQTTTLEGKPLKLADYRGRLVLLGFWAAWCGPCVTEIPDLRALHERFGRDSRFAMVSLSLDEDTDMVEAFRQKTPMPWTQCFLGEKERAATTRKYGVNSLPATFLIGPDGRILAINLRGPQIAEAVEKALAASNAAAASPSR